MGISGVTSNLYYQYGNYQNIRNGKESTEAKMNASQVELGNTSDTLIDETTAKGSNLVSKLNGEKKAPYSSLAKDGLIEYNGVIFQCDDEKNRITLGDVSDSKNCLNIPLSDGGSLVVNRDNLGQLAHAIGMFSAEDIRRILEAIALDNKVQEMQMKIDDDTNSIGDSADTAISQEPAEHMEETPDLMQTLQDKIDEIAEKIKKGDTKESFQIGGQSLTMEEWNKLLENIDADIDDIKEKQKERLEAKKEAEKEAKLQETNRIIARQLHKILTDVNESTLETYGPNALESVKQAWIEAAEKSGMNGAGIAANGRATHITAMSAERVVQWIAGETDYADILGSSVESAIAVTEKALSSLENAVQPVIERTLNVQEAIEQEKQFYNSFLEQLKVLL